MTIEPTYIVDSDQKLADWLHNETGNDYTHVYIADGRWKIDHEESTLVQPLDTIGTKTIEGAPNSVICDDDSKYVNWVDPSDPSTYINDYSVFSYSSLPTTKDYWIKGLHIEFKRYCVYAASPIFEKCINISNCYFYKTSDVEESTPKHGAAGQVLSDCYNISSCTFVIGYEPNCNNKAASVYGVSNCVNVYNCTFMLKNESPYVTSVDDDGLAAIDGCVNVSDCTVKFTPNSDISYMYYNMAPISNCSFITNCKVFSEGVYDVSYDYFWCQGITACIGKGFYFCKALRYCSNWSNGSLTGATFSSCYADYGGNTAVANTSTGGFNLVAT